MLLIVRWYSLEKELIKSNKKKGTYFFLEICSQSLSLKVFKAEKIQTCFELDVLIIVKYSANIKPSSAIGDPTHHLTSNQGNLFRVIKF